VKKATKLLAAILVFGAAVAPAGAGAPGGSDVKGPRCTDIVDSTAAGVTSRGVYDGAAQTVSFRIALAAPACHQMHYTLYVLAATGDTTPIAVSSSPTLQPGGDVLIFSGLDVSANTDSEVCVYATTSVGHHVFDRAPDTGCLELSSAATSPATGFH